VLGDFNIARAAEDKNTDHFDVASAALFTDTADALLLQELPLLDRRFTCTNNREVPTLVHLNCVFINAAWGTTLINTTLHSLPRPTSDHVPPPRHRLVCRPGVAGIQYEKSWGLHPDFCSHVQNVWARSQNVTTDPVACLVRSLKWTRVECKKWAHGRNRPDAVITACDLVVELLDLLEEVRPLTPQDLLLCRLVDARRSLPVKELIVNWRQCFSFKLRKFGDENTSFYHALSSTRLHSNKI
jgi:hypothetical protein